MHYSAPVSNALFLRSFFHFTTPLLTNCKNPSYTTLLLLLPSIERTCICIAWNWESMDLRHTCTPGRWRILFSGLLDCLPSLHGMSLYRSTWNQSNRPRFRRFVLVHSRFLLPFSSRCDVHQVSPRSQLWPVLCAQRICLSVERGQAMLIQSWSMSRPRPSRA
jgi:hypothetical protein